MSDFLFSAKYLLMGTMWSEVLKINCNKTDFSMVFFICMCEGDRFIHKEFVDVAWDFLCLVQEPVHLCTWIQCTYNGYNT